MNDSSTENLNLTFAALADPTRRAIMARLIEGDATVTELASPFDMSLPAVSKHLTVLEDAGLIAREREGRTRRCRVRAEPLRAAAEWIEVYRRFWEEQLDALAAFLDEDEEGHDPGEEHGKRKRKANRKR